MILSTWKRAEIDVNRGEINQSDLGFSFATKPEGKQPTLDVSFTLNNIHGLLSQGNWEKPLAEPKFTASFFKHIVVPRRIFIATDSRFKLIHNYIDIALQLSFNPKDFIVQPEASDALSHPVNVSMAASWQINKNNMAKVQVGTSSASYAIFFLFFSIFFPFPSPSPSLMHFQLETDTPKSLKLGGSQELVWPSLDLLIGKQQPLLLVFGSSLTLTMLWNMNPPLIPIRTLLVSLSPAESTKKIATMFNKNFEFKFIPFFYFILFGFP